MITVGDVRRCAEPHLGKWNPDTALAAQRLLEALSALPDDAQLGVLPQPDELAAKRDAAWEKYQEAKAATKEYEKAWRNSILGPESERTGYALGEARGDEEMRAWDFIQACQDVWDAQHPEGV